MLAFALCFGLAFFGSWYGWEWLNVKAGKIVATVSVVVTIILSLVALPLGIVCVLVLDVFGVLWLTGDRKGKPAMQFNPKATPCTCYYNNNGRQIYWCPDHAKILRQSQEPRNK